MPPPPLPTDRAVLLRMVDELKAFIDHYEDAAHRFKATRRPPPESGPALTLSHRYLDLPFDPASPGSFGAWLGQLPDPAVDGVFGFVRAAHGLLERVLDALDRASPPAPQWFPCSKAEVLRALGKDEHYTKYLDTLVRAGNLEMRDATKPVGRLKVEVKFLDPGQHEVIRSKIAKDRDPG